jgi:carboxyl-terminal processing protease
MNSRSRLVLASLMAVSLGLCLMLAGTVRAERPAAPPATEKEVVSWQDARLLAEILQRVRENYVQPVDDRKLMKGAARGLVEGLDEYSALLDRDEFQDLKLSTSGAYAGIGIEIEAAGEDINIVRCLGDSPAERAGLRAGDTLVGINGEPVKSGSLDGAISGMRGDVGTPVRLAVRREGKPMEFTVTRSRVELPSVVAQSLAPGFAYLRISSFTDATATEFEAAVARFRARSDQPLKGLVIDLRNNPGGVLDAAVAVADDLLESGTIVSADGRADDARFVSKAKPGDISNGAAIAVLVNAGSASAAEILAAALHDNQRAMLIGRKTYGKGSVQTIMPLSDGEALKLTTSHYYTPKGVSLDHRGISPDVQMEGAEAPVAEMDVSDAQPTLATRDNAVGLALQTLRGNTRVAGGKAPPPPRS